jgi:hypothetical protein
MSELTMEELHQIAREKFGRSLTDAEARSVARVLPVFAAVADRLLWWQSRLGETEPATIYSLASGRIRNEG